MTPQLILSFFLVGLPMAVFALMPHSVPMSASMAMTGDERSARITASRLPPLQNLTLPGNKPYPELLAHNYTLPEGSGCGERPDIPRNNSAPASKFFVPGNASDAGWSGFCELGWPLCPDAVANQDYSYYWRGLGPQWVNQARDDDSQYCLNNGWLEPEIARIVRNFTALQAKGEELCRTKYQNLTVDAEPFDLNRLTPVGGIVTGNSIRNAHKERAEIHGVKDYPSIDEEAAAVLAAWNCGLGDLSCDIAYCNYAYCMQPDGTVGVMDECEGWDAVRGMPALYNH